MQKWEYCVLATDSRELHTPQQCVVEICEPYQKMNLYWNATDEEPYSTLHPGLGKTFVVKEHRGAKMLTDLTEPYGDAWCYSCYALLVPR